MGLMARAPDDFKGKTLTQIYETTVDSYLQFFTEPTHSNREFLKEAMEHLKDDTARKEKLQKVLDSYGTPTRLMNELKPITKVFSAQRVTYEPKTENEQWDEVESA